VKVLAPLLICVWPSLTCPAPRLTPTLQVFSIGEEVKETNDSGFLGTVPTLHTQLLADNSLLQVRLSV
jgi:hypothetical protein